MELVQPEPFRAEVIALLICKNCVGVSTEREKGCFALANRRLGVTYANRLYDQCESRINTVSPKL